MWDVFTDHDREPAGVPVCERGNCYAMKKILELVLCILHPIAAVLIWISLLGRRDMPALHKLTWAVASIVPIVPFVYVLTGHDFI